MNVFNATGRLGRDCRVNQVGSSTVCNFAVAVKSGWGDKEQTVWLDCALWGKQAESRLPEYLTKGAQVAVSGELGTREHDGKTYLTLRVASVDLIGSKHQEQPSQNQQTAQGGSFDDDIPFARIGREWG